MNPVTESDHEALAMGPVTTRQPTNAVVAPAHAVPSPLPKRPRALGILGWANLAMGLVVFLVNGGVTWGSIARIQSAGLNASIIEPLWLAVGAYAAVGAVLALAGIGLCLGAKWGRLLSLVAAALLFLVVFVATACVGLTINRGYAQTEVRGSYSIFVMGGLPVLWPGYGMVLLVILNLPRVRAWARGVPLSTSTESPEQAPTQVVCRPTSKLAVVSIILALTPGALLTQLIGLITGTIALVRIGRSRGRLGGARLALAGILSSLLFTAATFIVFALIEMPALASNLYFSALGGLIMLGLIFVLRDRLVVGAKR
jgi:hypothetical protein